MARYDDGKRGFGVTDALSLSVAWRQFRTLVDAAAMQFPTREAPPRMVEFFKRTYPPEQWESAMRSQIQAEDAERIMIEAVKSGQLPLWIAPVEGVIAERQVAADSLIEFGRESLIAGCYRPYNDTDNKAYGYPLFVKNDDWARFVSSLEGNADLNAGSESAIAQSTEIQTESATGPQWKRFDEAVNLVAWLLTSPKAPTDYGNAGAVNLARLVREAKVRCRSGSITNDRMGVQTVIDAMSLDGQAQLQLVTECLADAIIQGSKAALTPERTRTFDLMAAIRKSPNAFPPQAREFLRASDRATGKVGNGEEIGRAFVAFSHAFDDLEALLGSTQGRDWRLVRADRDTSSFAFDFYRDALVIDVLGLQFSYADMWRVLGEEPASRVDASQSGEAETSKRKSRKGRTKGSGYQRADAPLLAKMREAIANNPALNATSAARLVADEAKGASFEAKVDRLSRAFRAEGNGE